MSKTGIPYAQMGWNFLVGCPGGKSDGCLNCWARELHDMRANAKRLGADLPDQYARNFRDIQWMETRMNEPKTWRDKKDVAVCFQSDLFHVMVYRRIQLEALLVMSWTPENRYLLLTKNPFEMMCALKDYFGDGRTWEVLNNIWPGVSICNQKEVAKARVLSEIHSENRWISMEPLLGPVNLDITSNLPKVVVVGCESGKDARLCDIRWVRDIRDWCKDKGVGLWVKQLQIDGKAVSDINKFPTDLQVREVFNDYGKAQLRNVDVDGEDFGQVKEEDSGAGLQADEVAGNNYPEAGPKLQTELQLA
jgi:protein gp37